MYLPPLERNPEINPGGHFIGGSSIGAQGAYVTPLFGEPHMQLYTCSYKRGTNSKAISCIVKLSTNLTHLVLLVQN